MKNLTIATGTIQIAMGAMSPPFRDQIKEQGLKADRKELDFLQRQADAVTLLLVNELIPEKVARRARQRISDGVARIAFPAN